MFCHKSEKTQHIIVVVAAESKSVIGFAIPGFFKLCVGVFFSCYLTICICFLTLINTTFNDFFNK